MEETKPKEARYQRRLGEVGGLVGQRVSQLLAGLQAQRPAATADLARLRRGVGKAPGQLPDIWELTAPPSSDVGYGDAATPAETAVHVAMTLFAVHQQSESQPMHVPGRSLAGAFGKLVRRHKDAVGEKSLRARFDAVVTATTFASVPYHLRGLVSLLKREGLGFDYGILADDICVLARGMQPDGPQWGHTGVEEVRRRWARDFRHLDQDEISVQKENK